MNTPRSSSGSTNFEYNQDTTPEIEEKSPEPSFIATVGSPTDFYRQTTICNSEIYNVGAVKRMYIIKDVCLRILHIQLHRTADLPLSARELLRKKLKRGFSALQSVEIFHENDLRLLNKENRYV